MIRAKGTARAGGGEEGAVRRKEDDSPVLRAAGGRKRRRMLEVAAEEVASGCGGVLGRVDREEMVIVDRGMLLVGDGSRERVKVVAGIVDEGSG